MSVTAWFLVSSSGTRHRLPREMIFVGRDDCELMLQSRSVDKQHAVINYDQKKDEHMVKDLGSLNGTFVNDLRIPEQTYITLKLSDVIRFGYDAHVYILERSQHKVPEEALKHEKYTSQLQLSIKSLEAKAKEKQQLQNSEKGSDCVSSIKLQDKSERRAQSLTASTDSPISKPTPLYGQPSWWGEDEDAANKKQNRGGKMPGRESPEPAKDGSRYEVNGSLSDSQTKAMFSYRREPSYFEIPTKEFQQQTAKKQESQIHEVPTKDTSDPSPCVPSTPTPPVVQSHASFTIEFDECTPGKLKIKDHVTKFAFRQQRKQPSTEVATTPTEVMSAESKVADWLVQSNASMMRRRSQCEDTYTADSDPSLPRNAKANHSEDGSRSESGHPTLNGQDFPQSEPQIGSHGSPQNLRASPPQRYVSPDSKERLSHSPPESQSLSSQSKAEPHQAFVIEFFEENQRKKRSQSFTSSAAPPEPSSPQLLQDKARKSSSPTGEGRVPPTSSSTPPTQRYTIPLKGPAPSGFQRAGSLRKEKTEERMSTSFSSRSSSSVSARPYSSVGRRSRLAQDFTAEMLKQKQNSASSCERNPPGSPKAIQRGSGVDQRITSPPPSAGHVQPQTSSPINQPVPLKAPTMPPAPQNVEAKSLRNEEEDSLSDAGTYTIEADIPDKDLEEARSKIDKVFGVVESTEPANQSDAQTSSAFRPVIGQGSEEHRQSSSAEAQPAGAVLQGAPKWMSRWASLADSYAESGYSSRAIDIPPQMELSPRAQGAVTHQATPNPHNSSDEGSKTRHILPQEDRSDVPTPIIHVHYNPNSTFNVEDSSSVAPRSQDAIHRLTVQDDVEPDSLSDASRSDEGSIVEQIARQLSDTEEKQNKDKPRLPDKSTSFYIGSEEESRPQRGGLKPSTPKAERKHMTRTFSTATLTKQKRSQEPGKVKPSASAPRLNQDTQGPEGKESTSFPLIRQESFTKEKPSNARLPDISSMNIQRDSVSGLLQGTNSQDTHSYLKQTEDVLAVLEAKLYAGQSGTTPSPVNDSLSGDSDVDTSSTVSHHSNRTKPNVLVKKTSSGGLHRERSSASIAQDSNHQSSSEKHRPYGSNATAKADPVRKPVALRRSAGKRGSTDLSDDPQSLPYSDQESSNAQTRRKYHTPLRKEDGKTSRVSQVLSRANSLSAPRPTRASMLRRARLAESSDNEGTETERPSQETVNTHVKPPQEAKKLSRLDMLAMPRKRSGSFNTPSDTEAAAPPQWTGRSAGFSNRSTESSGSSIQRASTPGAKPAERPQKAALGRAPLTRGRSSSAKYASSTATSHSPRSQTRPQPIVARHPKSHSRDSEEDNNEGGAFHQWSSHSVEIARLSQDLAKDLAILAREIHDVAGDGEPQTPGAELDTEVSTRQQPISESGSNHKIQTSCAPKREAEQSCGDHEQSSKHQAESGDKDVVMDCLMLNPLYQVILAIRENTEQLADKIKVLFQDRMDVWEEIEANINAAGDNSVESSSNKEILTILKELRSVQRRLEVINTVMEPTDTPESTKASASSSSSGVRSSRSSSSRDWRTIHSMSKRGGGPRPSESVRRAAVTPEDLRQGYLV
ncbi:centrosomal protein of 170 kDa protein B isoform 2-T2 [Menidia menidia]